MELSTITVAGMRYEVMLTGDHLKEVISYHSSTEILEYLFVQVREAEDSPVFI